MVFFLLVMASIFSCSGPQSRNRGPLSTDLERASSLATNAHPEDDPAYGMAKEFDALLAEQLPKEKVEALEELCRVSPTENVFCFSVINREYFEEKVKARKERVADSAPRTRLRRVFPKIKKGKVSNWVELRFASVAASLRGVQGLTDANLNLLKDVAIKEKQCPNNVAISIAATLEDKLPEKAKLDEIALLYERGGMCIVNNTADRENMLTRSALFYYAAKQMSDAERLLKEAIGTPNSFAARPIYWLYRVYAEQKNETESKKLLEKLETEYPFAFHTLIAMTARSEDPGNVLLKRSLNQTTRSNQMPLVNPLIEQVEVLHRLGFDTAASKVLNWAVAESYGTEPEVKIYLAELKKEQGDFHGKISILSDVLYRNPSLVSKETMELYFPKVFFPIFERQSSIIDPYLLISIARRESAFNVKAVSSANAHGLMQLLPAVKRELMKKQNNLFDPNDNVEVGAHYVLKLLKQTEGQIHLALAAYNAGPHKVSTWTERYPASDPILFVDLIPYRETREYVASVLRNYYWYRRIHQNDQNLTPQRILELAVTKGG
jgi:soluble lytic murein transglycosylase